MRIAMALAVLFACDGEAAPTPAPDASTTSTDGGMGGSDGGPIGGDAAPGRDGGTFSSEPYPSIHPLELVLPRAAGSVPIEGTRGVGLTPDAPFPAVPATHRIFKAYPGLPYEIRAAVIGGSYPYTFALRDAPSGMTVDARTGEIVWPSPDADATPTIVVTDMEGTEVSSSWSIEVTEEGFLFVDGAAGNPHPTGDGSRDDPFRDFADLKNAPAASYGDIVYFRAGVYGPGDIPRDGVGGAWERIDWGREDPQSWLAYPGETPIVDFGFVDGVDRAAIFRVGGAYIDGLETRNARNIGFQLVGGDYNVIRRVDMHDHNPGGEDLDGQNPAHIMSVDGEKWYTIIQDSDFHGAPTAGGLKLYNEGKILIEDNRFYDAAAACDWKVGIERGTFRRNHVHDITDTGLYGNMSHRYEMYVRNGEVCYNLFDVPELVDDGWDNGAIGLNWDGFAGRFDVYRNTIVGRVYVAQASADTGPFHWARNVIVNDDTDAPDGAHISHHEVGDASRITTDDNLVGTPTDGIVDADGNLTAAYASHRGTHGYELPF